MFPEKAASRARSVSCDGFIIPLLILPEVDVTQRFTIQHQFAGFEARIFTASTTPPITAGN